MSASMLGLVCIFALFALLLLRVHIGVALGITSLLGFYLITGDFNIAIGLLTTTPYATVAQFVFTVIPLFILMGSFSGYAGFAESAYETATKLAGRLPGGLAIATTLANALFGAACGSSISACVVFAKFSLPEMTRHGYQKEFACGSIIAAGCLAMLIPPSTLMIVYGILAEQSIGALFIAGIFPGLLLTALLCIGIFIMAKVKPELVNEGKGLIAGETWKERLLSIRNIWGVGLLAITVLGGIYTGVFSPTESGAAAAFVAFVAAFIKRKLSWGVIRDSFLEAAQTTGMLFFILIGAFMFSKFLAVTQIPANFVEWVMSGHWPPLAVLISFIVMYLILGTMLDSIAMMTITLPLVVPVSVAMGWDPIWFAIVVVISLEMGLFTPPMGITIYAVKAVVGPEIELDALFRAVAPFFIFMVIELVLIVAFPPISTWLPKLMR